MSDCGQAMRLLQSLTDENQDIILQVYARSAQRHPLSFGTLSDCGQSMRLLQALNDDYGNVLGSPPMLGGTDESVVIAIEDQMTTAGLSFPDALDMLVVCVEAGQSRRKVFRL